MISIQRPPAWTGCRQDSLLRPEADVHVLFSGKDTGHASHWYWLVPDLPGKGSFSGQRGLPEGAADGAGCGGNQHSAADNRPLR
jgi:hypothetical protein